jgi:hypothetical protein
LVHACRLQDLQQQRREARHLLHHMYHVWGHRPADSGCKDAPGCLPAGDSVPALRGAGAELPGL